MGIKTDKTEDIHFRVTPEEKLQMQTKAEKAGLSLSEYLIRCKCQHKNVGFMENKYVRKMTFLFSIFFNFPQSNIASGL